MCNFKSKRQAVYFSVSLFPGRTEPGSRGSNYNAKDLPHKYVRLADDQHCWFDQMSCLKGNELTSFPDNMCSPQLDAKKNNNHEKTKDQARHKEDKQKWLFFTMLLLHVIKSSWQKNRMLLVQQKSCLSLYVALAVLTV